MVVAELVATDIFIAEPVVVPLICTVVPLAAAADTSTFEVPKGTSTL